LAYLLELAGILSVNLALLNILPLPALDGGRILFLFLEGLRGGVKINPRWEQMVHTAGFVLILLLMAAVTYRDIVRIF
jgi:regulator of sigma E protease